MSLKHFFMIVFMVAAFGALSACGSDWEPETLGIGIDPTELKRSPCACTQIEFDRSVPSWFAEELSQQG